MTYKTRSFVVVSMLWSKSFLFNKGQAYLIILNTKVDIVCQDCYKFESHSGENFFHFLPFLSQGLQNKNKTSKAKLDSMAEWSRCENRVEEWKIIVTQEFQSQLSQIGIFNLLGLTSFFHLSIGRMLKAPPLNSSDLHLSVIKYNSPTFLWCLVGV